MDASINFNVQAYPGGMHGATFGFGFIINQTMNPSHHSKYGLYSVGPRYLIKSFGMYHVRCMASHLAGCSGGFALHALQLPLNIKY